jgi:LacI family transcriptional regulator
VTIRLNRTRTATPPFGTVLAREIPAVKALTSRKRTRRRRGATIYEVARHAGVSIATVSRVHRGRQSVAPGTRERVLAAAAALDYRASPLATSLVRGRHDAIGIVFPDLSGPYYSAVILGYEEAPASEGSSALILATHCREGQARRLVLDLADRVDGLVLMERTVEDGVVEELERQNLPIVLLARPPVGSADSVRVENRAVAVRLVAHLLEHGHRRIGFLGDPEASPDVFERWAGFVDAHREAGCRPWPSPIGCDHRETAGRLAALAALREEERPTALVCANDEVAIGALAAVRELGQSVPHDVVLTGWDDIPAARHVATPLTTVRQPMVELGRRAAQLLHERISDHRAEPRHVMLPAELVIRTSCGCGLAADKEVDR